MRTTVTQQRRGCDLDPDPSAPESTERPVIIIIIILNCLQHTNFSQWQLRHMDLRTRLRYLLSLSWCVRSRNTRTTRLTVVTFSSESACSFSDITPFFSVRPSRLKMKSTRSHSSLVLVCLVLNPGDLYYAACASHVAFIYYLAAKGASHLYAGKIKYTYAC